MGLNVAVIKKWIDRHNPQGATKLAGQAEVSLSTLNNILKQKHTPGIDVVIRLAKVLNVSLDELCASGRERAKPPAA